MVSQHPKRIFDRAVELVKGGARPEAEALCRQALEQNPALRHVEDSLFELIDGQRTVQAHVAPDGRTILWVAVGSESGVDEPDLEYLTPTLSPGWILTWVDPAHPLAALEFTLHFAQAIEGHGPWVEFAEARTLRLSLSPEFQPSLSGSLNGREVHLRPRVSTVSITTAVDDSLRAVPGSGATGNPVLDMFLDTSNVSADLTESVLALLHHGNGQIQHGTLTSIVPIGLAEAWPHLVRLTGFCEADP